MALQLFVLMFFLGYLQIKIWKKQYRCLIYCFCFTHLLKTLRGPELWSKILLMLREEKRSLCFEPAVTKHIFFLSILHLKKLKKQFLISHKIKTLSSTIVSNLLLFSSLQYLLCSMLFNRDSDSLEHSFHHFLLPREIYFR